MAKKFNIADFIPQSYDVSNLGTMEISLIPWDRIRVNGENFYDTSDVEDLRNSIQMHGLLDPVTVTPDAEDGYYLLISGHRRHKAWGLLRDEEPEKYERIPAMIRRFESKNMAELALIMANSTTRVLTPAEVSRQAERIERLLYDLKEEGYTFNGRMRDQVAKACQVSSSRIGRLKMIREKLLLDFRVLWDKNKLPESVAYELAQGSSTFQALILRVAPNATAQGIARVRKIYEAGNDYGCADLTGPGCAKCTHRDAFVRHDLEDYNTCEGKTCCLKCERGGKATYWPCDRMCSKAKDKRSKDNARKKAREAAEEERQLNARNAAIRESCRRLARAADAAGVDDDENIRTRYGGYSVGMIRTLASGDFSNAHFWCDPFTSAEGLDVAAAAKALHCSADYVCGLTEELHPTAPAAQDDGGADEVYMAASKVLDPDWMPGNPPGDGRYLCLVDMDRAGIPEHLHEQMLDLKAGIWHAYGRTVDDMFDVVGWWPLPAKWGHWKGLPGTPRIKEAEDEESDD